MFLRGKTSTLPNFVCVLHTTALVHPLIVFNIPSGELSLAVYGVTHFNSTVDFVAHHAVWGEEMRQGNRVYSLVHETKNQGRFRFIVLDMRYAWRGVLVFVLFFWLAVCVNYVEPHPHSLLSCLRHSHQPS